MLIVASKLGSGEIEALGSYLSFVACLFLTVMGRST